MWNRFLVSFYVGSAPLFGTPIKPIYMYVNKVTTHVKLEWVWPVRGHLIVLDQNKQVESIYCVILRQNRALVCSHNAELNACKISSTRELYYVTCVALMRLWEALTSK